MFIMRRNEYEIITIKTNKIKLYQYYEKNKAIVKTGNKKVEKITKNISKNVAEKWTNTKQNSAKTLVKKT